MLYIKTFDRDQMMFCSWDSLVDEQSIARVIDAFVDSLNLVHLEVKESATEGRLAYELRGFISYLFMEIEKVFVKKTSRKLHCKY